MASAADRSPANRRLLRAPRPPVLHVAVDEGDGPPVVLLHGIASSSTTFQHVIPLLRGDHRLVAIDLLGFGASPAPADSSYSVEDHVHAIEATLARRGMPKEFVLVGHSMGSLIAARLAVRLPRRVRALVLVNPPIYLHPDELSNPIGRRLMDLHLRGYRFIKENPAFTLRTARMLSQLLPIRGMVRLDEPGWHAFERSLANSIESQTTLHDLARVAVPVELIVGTMDEFASEDVLRIASRFTGVTTHRVLGAHHLIGRRMARVVAQAVRSTSAG